MQHFKELNALLFVHLRKYPVIFKLDGNFLNAHAPIGAMGGYRGVGRRTYDERRRTTTTNDVQK